MTAAASGRLIGVGTGPGDPDLLTVKALRVLAAADVVAHFAKRGNKGNARATVEGKLKPGVIELALHYPVTTELDRRSAGYCGAIGGFYEASAAAVAEHLAAGRSVAVLSEGDPLFYGSYMHLHVRLSGLYPTEVVPGVTAMSGCWSSVGAPLGQDFCVLSLSDNLKPGPVVEARLAAAAGAGLVIALYNPVSRARPWQLAAAFEQLRKSLPSDTAVVFGRAAGRSDERLRVTTLAEADAAWADMATCVIIGSRETRTLERPGRPPLVYTPRFHAEAKR